MRPENKIIGRFRLKNKNIKKNYYDSIPVHCIIQLPEASTPHTMKNHFSIVQKSAITRFIVSGTTGALIHFCILILFYETLNASLLFSTTVAFLVASIVSFTLQKFWAFQERSSVAIPRQAFLYLFLTGTNIVVNGYLMHWFTETLSLQYLLAQIFTSGLIAVESYFFYKRVVFMTKP